MLVNQQETNLMDTCSGVQGYRLIKGRLSQVCCRGLLNLLRVLLRRDPGLEGAPEVAESSKRGAIKLSLSGSIGVFKGKGD